MNPVVLFAGLTQAQVPTQWGGELLLLPLNVIDGCIPIGGLDLDFVVACDTQFCGVSIYLQALQIDPGASAGVSFTPGIDLFLGT